MFLTHHNLQGSQTQPVIVTNNGEFLTHHNLQGSQTLRHYSQQSRGFLPIIIYKVLKPKDGGKNGGTCFLPIIIYKVLKRFRRIEK